MLDVELNTKLLEYLIVKLSAIVSDNGVGESKSIDDGFLEKILTLLSVMCAKNSTSIHLM